MDVSEKAIKKAIAQFGNDDIEFHVADGTQLLFGYDHRNLWKCFSGARNLVTQLLEFASEPEYIIHLLFDGTYFTADLPPMIFEGRNQFYLVFETEMLSIFCSKTG